MTQPFHLSSALNSNTKNHRHDEGQLGTRGGRGELLLSKGVATKTTCAYLNDPSSISPIM